ncbi:peptide deformylase, mitochondrial isoform X1 [Girardinichthys multiradiatus]|uniref:peptide deformylase, mitochondrial isoform X1 n=1 Tax=Girardinichthys multiradiatus TaxID=208333 RepID=UPI001FAD0799|nr:peptide deformylase, mitochondrial isoform X1 [Girardinichthys multiradiatus]
MTTKSSVSLLLFSWSRFRFCASRAPCSTFGPLIQTTPPSHISVCRRSLSSTVKVRSYLQYVKRKIKSPPSPPYSHVCQVGDPVLRSHAAAVDPAAITGLEIQKVLGTMVKVMRKLECVGLSAPQIGVPLRILMLEYPWKLFEEVSPAAREARGLSVQPLRIFVNPELRVLDSRTVLFQEACESISGFSATVPRYLSVEVSGTFVKYTQDKFGFINTDAPIRLFLADTDFQFSLGSCLSHADFYGFRFLPQSSNT